MKNKTILNKVVSLSKDFTENKISGRQFEKEYMKMWIYIRDKDIQFSKQIHKILDELWCDTDAFVSDQKLLEESRKESPELAKLDIDEKEYRKRTKKALDKLNKLIKENRIYES